MNRIVASAPRSLLAGLAICAVVLLVWLVNSPFDGIGLASFLLRWLHILGGIVWVGMIWFVNFIQLAAVQEADDAGRALLHKTITGRVARTFKHASHLTILTGVLLLMSTGYVLDRWVFPAAVYIPPLRSALLWVGAAAGLAMWVFVHFIIWPNLQVALGERPGDDAAKARAREQVRVYARLNLVLAIPVTFLMVAATHLY